MNDIMETTCKNKVHKVSVRDYDLATKLDAIYNKQLEARKKARQMMTCQF